jgi:hypothetical protein
MFTHEEEEKKYIYIRIFLSFGSVSILAGINITQFDKG